MHGKYIPIICICHAKRIEYYLPGGSDGVIYGSRLKEIFVFLPSFDIITITKFSEEMERAMDPVHFSSKEILEMAVRIEENGLGFYKSASASTDNAQIKELFDYLIIEEVKHVELFEALKEAITEGEPSDYNDPYLEEESKYLNALADSSIFMKGEEGVNKAKAIKSDDEALDFAIQMEKDSILFYLELINMVRDHDRPTVKNILSEERKHIAKLTELRASL